MKNQISTIYHAAIYVRLSKEDGDVADAKKAESNSISNQRSLIKNYLKDIKNIASTKEYVDDGYTGSNFERPAFQEMLQDIKTGKINLVCIKDLSRFGREYIDSGMYIERLFPSLGVRFISINDNIDSMSEHNYSDEIMIPFKNLLNDAYCRDISIKIRSHLEIKRKNGEFIGSFPVYGYMKDPEDHHKLLVDEYAADIVRDIFRLKLQGMSQESIAKRLNEKDVLSPADYKASCGMNYRTSFKVKARSEWTAVAVRRILTDEFYIGNLVQGKRTTPNHKIKKSYERDADEWIRIEKNHDPIVSDREFEVVARLLDMDTRISPNQKTVYPLSGLVTCSECKYPMIRKPSKVGGRTYAYYLCPNCKDKKNRLRHRISAEVLEKEVLSMLQKHIDSLIDLEEIFRYTDELSFRQLDLQKLDNRRRKKEADIARCLELRSMLYEDLKDGLISKEEYREYRSTYDNRQKTAEKALRQIELERKEVENRKDDKNLWIECFKEHKNIQCLDRNVCASLIRDVSIDDKKNIEITCDFDDAYKAAMAGLKRDESMGDVKDFVPVDVVKGREAV